MDAEYRAATTGYVGDEPEGEAEESAAEAESDPENSQSEMNLDGGTEPQGVPLFDLDGQEVDTYTDPIKWFGALQSEIANEAKDRDPALCENWLERNADGAQAWIAAGDKRASALWQQVKRDAIEAALAAGASE